MGDIANYKSKFIKAKISKRIHFFLNYLKKTSKKVKKRFLRRIYKIRLSEDNLLYMWQKKKNL